MAEMVDAGDLKFPDVNREGSSPSTRTTIESWERFNAIERKLINGWYRDNSYNERECDYCRKPYKGPAVYCCIECALADA